MRQPREPGFEAALEQARSEAAERGHDRIATRHLLLGLLDVPESVAPAVLTSLNVDLGRLRRRVETSLPRARRPTNRDRLPFSANARRVLELAEAEATAGGGAAGGAAPPLLRTEHLLLGLMTLQGDVAQLLAEAGAALAAVRWELLRLPGVPAPRLPFVRLTPASGVPVYQQIVDQLREAVAEGRLRTDDRLPPVRQLAADLAVAPGTTARAYQELEQLGVVVTDGARGTRIARMRAAELSSDERTARLVNLLRPVAVTSAYLGATPDEVREALEQALAAIFPAETSLNTGRSTS